MKSIWISAAAFSLGLASAVQAGDLCLDAARLDPPTLGRPTIILRGFKYPKKNKCKSVSGVFAASVPSQPSAVTGAACTSFDGTNVSFTLVAINSSGTGLAARAEYSAKVMPQGNVSNGSMLSILPSGNLLTPIVAFECHDAFPDNL
jgi:hypothetical protein